MKDTKIILSAIALLSAGLANGAVYTGASVGYLIDDEEPVFAAQLGYQWETGQTVDYGLELEVAYTDYSDSIGDVEVIPLMVNAKIGYTFSESLSYYGGFGIGSSNVDATAYGFSMSDDVLTYQIFLGLQYHLTDSTSLKLGYRYINLQDVFDVDDLDDSAIEVGITFAF